ncbi:MAG TPA: transglycosylase SLT domain-containing protein [Burkholderiaceae bacterium]|nr:transglycosylase SLT domain-containing protein [Burkholderiaceae bacterium]
MLMRPFFAIAWAGTLCLAANAWSATLETVHPTVPEVAPLPPDPAHPAPATDGSKTQFAPDEVQESPNMPQTAPANGAATDAVPSVQDLETPDEASPAPEAKTPASPQAPAAAQAPATAPAMPAAAKAASEDQAAQAAAIAAGDLWQRIRKGFQMPDLTNKKAVVSTRWYAGQPDYLDRMTTRASLYLYYIVQEIEKRGMPTELALLPFVESAMQPQAISSAQAAGLWQFIPSTGRMYSLEQNLWKDERFGVVESTRAALDYLQKLHDEFGSWQLALAAYNYGENGVERALDYNRKHHKPLTYESLVKLPRETQYYLPKLQALKNIVSNPQRYGIELPAIRDQPYFVSISGSRDIDVATAAQLADMPLEDFQALNPAFNRPLIVGAMAPTILLPADRGDKFGANLAAWEATGQPLASWTAYRLKGGETLTAVAERIGVSEASLRTANHVPPRYILGAGSTILVPRDEAAGEDVSGDLLEGSVALVPEQPGLRKITIKVRRGESIGAIARHWHVGEDEIIAWNDLRSPALLAGQRLSLTVASSAISHKKSSRSKRANSDSTTVARASSSH